MSATFPFQLSPAPPPISPEYQLVIFADVGGLEDYYALFQHFGFLFNCIFFFFVKNFDSSSSSQRDRVNDKLGIVSGQLS